MSRGRGGFFGWLGAAAVVALPAFAQYPGRVNPDQQPNTTHLRATAVLEYTGDLAHPHASRLVPVAVWDGTQYQPGSLYLAQPAPLAVLTGTQYELETAGRPKGFFNIKEAENLAGLWIGVGSFQAPAPPKPKAARARHMPYQVKEVDPDKPHFAHRPAEDTNQGGSGGTAQSGAQSAPPVDPDRPTLHERPNAGSDSGSNSGSGSNSTGQGDVDPDRPTFHRRASNPGEVATAQPAIDPDRPRLGYSAPAQQEKLDLPDALKGLPQDMNQMAGVSDTHPLDNQSWIYSWANPDDEAKMKAALEMIAEKAVALPPATQTGKTAGAAGTHRTSHRSSHLPTAPKLPMLADEEFHAYDLSFGGGATMVLSAHTTAAPVKYVTIIAQPDFYGQPQVLLKQVTSENQMDVIPRMRLVDAVDTQGNGRADLIFELRGRTYRQFAIYRIAGGTAMQAFLTQPGPN